MILSASRRTDVPAFYAPWFMKRIRAGFLNVPNPIRPRQKTKPIRLSPNDIDAIVFWTRNPKPLMRYLPELDARGYRYYFQYTLIGYPSIIDANAPPIASSIDTFCALSRRIGKEKVIWRYDPILFSSRTPERWHKNQIASITKQLQGYTERLMISFIDPYRKTILRMRGKTGGNFALAPDAFIAETYSALAAWIARKMKGAHITVMTCAEKIDLLRYGIEHGKCIDDRLIRRITGKPVTPKKDPGQRKLCGCVLSKDIGIHNTCLFGCTYCYATNSVKKARENYKKHNALSPYLIPQKS